MRLAGAESSRTDWSLIVDVAEADGAASAEAMERLVRRYWPAIYAYIRRSGRDVHEASDMTQGFVCDVIISRRLCDYADPKRGRFRTLLLSAVSNYLRERHRRARGRSGNHTASPIRPTSSELASVEVAETETPEDAFSYQWSAMLVRQVLADVRTACIADGLDPHWDVFEHRVVRSMLLGDPPTDYATLVERLRLKDESQAANMMITVKRRFVRQLRAEIGRTVREPGQIEDELHELLRDLERPR